MYVECAVCIQADYVVLALAPSLQTRIQFEPALPSVRTQLNQRMPMGSVIKCMVYYDRPYWKEKGTKFKQYSSTKVQWKHVVKLLIKI